MGDIAVFTPDRLSGAERFRQTLMALGRHQMETAAELYAKAPILVWEGPDRAFTERLQSASVLTRAVATDLQLALTRYALLDEFCRFLIGMGQVVHEGIQMAWTLGRQSTAHELPPDNLKALLHSHDAVWVQGQMDQYTARDQWGQVACSLWAAWSAFTRTRWRVPPEIPLQAWIPVLQADTDILQLIQTLKTLGPDSESQETYRAMLEHSWQQTLEAIGGL